MAGNLIRKTCNEIIVPKETCYLRFSAQKVDYSFDGTVLRRDKRGKVRIKGKPFETARGELMIIDFNRKGQIIGIELLDSPEARKPCQRNTR